MTAAAGGWQNILNSFEAVTLIKLILAAVCGGFIGAEREMKGRPAGLKTFALVCMGAALAMVTNEYIYENIAGNSGDSARMAAQVISGIGFLGAGTIMITGHNQVKGLTTAAALWMTAAIGISIGSGFYFGGISGVVIMVLFSYIYRNIDSYILSRSRVMRVYVEGMDEEFMLRLIAFFQSNGIKVTALTRRSENKWYSEDTSASIELDLMKKQRHEDILKKIQQLKGVRYVEEI